MSVASPGNHQVVAAVFPFVADNVRHPPRGGGIIEKETFQDPLEDIGQVVATRYMRQLVKQHGFDLIWRQTSHRPKRRQDHGTEVTEDHGNIGEEGLKKHDRSRDSYLFPQMRERCLPKCRSVTSSRVTQPVC